MQEKLQIYISGGDTKWRRELHSSTPAPSVDTMASVLRTSPGIDSEAGVYVRAGCQKNMFILLLLHVLYNSQIVNFDIFLLRNSILIDLF